MKRSILALEYTVLVETRLKHLQKKNKINNVHVSYTWYKSLWQVKLILFTKFSRKLKIKILLMEMEWLRITLLQSLVSWKFVRYSWVSTFSRKLNISNVCSWLNHCFWVLHNLCLSTICYSIFIWMKNNLPIFKEFWCIS